MASSLTDFNIGRDCELVVIAGNLGRIDLREVEGFKSHQIVSKPRIKPLNRRPVEKHIAEGWEGEFDIARGNASCDKLVHSLESNFWAGNGLPYGTIYQYVRELDGSTTTFQFNSVSMHLSDAGDWKSDAPVKLKLSFFASERVLIS